MDKKRMIPKDISRKIYMETDLLPCPFCGGKAHVWRTSYQTYVECENFHADTHRVMFASITDSDAFRLWNQRVDTVAIKEEFDDRQA